MWPAVIGAAGSLLGGVLNRNSAKAAAAQNRKWALEDQAEQFVRLRAAAEKAGFNPLTALGAAPNSGMPNQTQAAQSYVGTAIADSAAMLADGMTKQQLAINAKAEDLARQKAILERKLTEATLRPDQPGIFQRAGSFGTAKNKPDEGGSNGKPNSDHPLVDSLGDVAVPDSTLDRGPGFYVGGVYLEAPPGTTTPAELENSTFGDNPLVQWPYGLWYSSAMAGHNLGRLRLHLQRKANQKQGGYSFKSGGQIYMMMPPEKTASQRYKPSPFPGYDALTGSYPMERVSGK